MNIIFLDIDGVLIPRRAFFLPNQTEEVMTIFDPCAVSLINKLAEEINSKIAVHSSWRKTAFLEQYGVVSTIDHMVGQGIETEHFYKEAECPWNRSSTRWDEILLWIADNGVPDKFVIIDDYPPPSDFKYKDNCVTTDFDEGFIYKSFEEAKLIINS